jgi:hypothetical protein
VWSAATAFAHVIGDVTLHGRRLWRVSFLDRSTPAWFEILVDTATYRTVRVEMVAQSHFMRQSNSDFNRAVSIEVPPK